MNKFNVFRISLLTGLLATSYALTYSDCTSNCESILSLNDWYIMPKIGVAPGIFAHRGYIRQISPLGGNFEGQSSVTCIEIGSESLPALVESNKDNVLQIRSNGMPRFGQIYHNSILHVGFELGRNVCKNIQLYLEFTYNRATAKNYCEAPIVFSSPDGCAGLCDGSSTPLANQHELRLKLDTYTAYGAFVGARYVCNTSYFCDRITPWIGFKTGLLHRKSIGVCATVPEFIDEVPNVGEYTFPAFNNFRGTAFCKGTAVAGALSLGFDYCLTNCLTVLFGFEVLSSCPFHSNPNISIPLGDTPIPIGSAPELPNGVFHKPINVLPGSTGTFVQFPIWFGLQWEFDFCKSAC